LDSEPFLPRWRHTLRYCAQTEAHVFALSIAASVLLSFYPFLIVVVSVCKYAIRWPAAVDAIYYALNDYLPGEVGQYISRNLDVSVRSHGRVQVISLLLLLFTANGVFEPLEVALNRVWGAPKNRSYVKNQVLSLGLILLCGALVLSSFLLAAVNADFLKSELNLRFLPAWMAFAVFKLAAIPMTILALFLIYWLVPNCKIPRRVVARTAIVIGLSFEGLKYVNLRVWPYFKLKLEREYGPFYISVSVVLLSFILAMIVLAGAQWAARRPDQQLSSRALTLDTDEKLEGDRVG
jgi:membrane protein